MNNGVRTVGVTFLEDSASWNDKAFRILRRQITSRCTANVHCQADEDCVIELGIDSHIGQEGYRIMQQDRQTIRITGDGLPGLMHGIGKFLRDSRYEHDGFCPGNWRGLSVPDKELRGIYFATHFGTFYESAPIEKMTEYIEDLVLWGFNTIMVWYDMHHYRGIDDPAAQKTIQRLRTVLHEAKQVGMKTCLGGLGNEAYAGSPEHLRADFKTGRANYGVELCPQKAGAADLLLHWFDQELEIFEDLNPDYIVLTPYDQGGCACDKCSPWGSNGYIEISKKKAVLAKNRFPNSKFILSTWLFDYGKDQGEWRGLAEAFREKPDWCDYIMAGAHDGFPEYLIKNEVPAHLPLVIFPEISMWEMYPWGGFGANPFPSRCNSLWQTTKDRVCGGFPYSEGIFEDINKIIFAGFYWNSNAAAEDIVREYASFEFSPDAADEVLRAIMILEKIHGHCWFIDWITRRHFCRRETIDEAAANEAFGILDRVNARLTPQAQKRWRWRILYLRAVIEKELVETHGFRANDACEKAFEELTEIYHAQQAEYKCSPPTLEAIKAMRTSECKV